MKNGSSLPGWAMGLIIAIFVVAVVGVGYKFVMGAGPVDPASLPRDQVQNPYLNSDFGKKFQQQHSGDGATQRPVNPHQ